MQTVTKMMRRSADSDKNDETQCILKSMQTMIGTLVQKVSDIEKSTRNRLRGKATDDDADSMCDESVKTAPGRGEEDENTDACSSVLRGQFFQSTRLHGMLTLCYNT